MHFGTLEKLCWSLGENVLSILGNWIFKKKFDGLTWIVMPYWMTEPMLFWTSLAFCFFSTSAACWKKNHIILLRVQKCWKCIVDTIECIFCCQYACPKMGFFWECPNWIKIIYHAYNKRWEELGVIFHAGKYCCHIVKSVLKISIKYWLWLSARFWLDQ